MNMKIQKKLNELFDYFTENELLSRQKNLEWVKEMIPEWLKEGGEDHAILCTSFYLFGGDRGQLSNEKKLSVHYGKHTKEDK